MAETLTYKVQKYTEDIKNIFKWRLQRILKTKHIQSTICH